MNPHRPRLRRPIPLSPAPRPRTEAPRVRLQKLLAAAGYGSRREIEAWIASGRITLAGRVARLGDRAAPGDAIALDGAPIAISAAPERSRVIAYHKPQGELVTRSDPQGRRTVFEAMPPLQRGRWVAVGRLDFNTSGLLLLTNSGALANRLMHPRQRIEREYAVRVRGELGEVTRRRLLAGVRLEDGMARFERLEPTGRRSGANRWYRASLREGRNREVRRIFEAAGLQVSRLTRIGFGPVRLPADLKPGRWIELPPLEVERLSLI